MAMSASQGQAARLDTALVPFSERVEIWHESLRTSLLPVSVSSVSEDFQGVMTLQNLGPVTALEIDAGRMVVTRSKQDIARRNSESIFVFQQLGQGSRVLLNGVEDGQVRRGTLVVGDFDEWCESRPLDHYHHRIWVFPREIIPAGLIKPGVLEKGLYMGGGGAPTLLWSYLQELSNQWTHMDPATAASFALNAGRLLATVSQAAEHEECRIGVAAGQFAMIKQVIERHLRNPLLDPTRVAQTCGISVRKLHQLFEPTGTTFSRYVLQRRMEEAYATITNPASASRPLTSVAYAMGFNSLGTFYRTYRNHFGETPGDTRERVFGAFSSSAG